jgi:glycerol-3-phosphate acyltransferase PlsY
MILQIILITLLFCVIGYAIGNILFAPIFVSLFHKEKIREKGSKNPGGANTTRIYGKKLGIVVILCDALKTYLVIIFS